jgi:hypothetical protein
MNLCVFYSLKMYLDGENTKHNHLCVFIDTFDTVHASA